MVKKLVKYVIYIILNIYINSIGRVAYILSKRYASFHTKAIHFMEWSFNEKSGLKEIGKINFYRFIQKYTPSVAPCVRIPVRSVI